MILNNFSVHVFQILFIILFVICLCVFINVVKSRIVSDSVSQSSSLKNRALGSDTNFIKNNEELDVTSKYEKLHYENFIQTYLTDKLVDVINFINNGERYTESKN